MAIISDEPGPHVINGTDYSDTIEANDGNDTVYAKLGDDWVFGGDGDDRLYGGSKSSPSQGRRMKDLDPIYRARWRG
jgi:Ca2+-binding RTX toxin-like protein